MTDTQSGIRTRVLELEVLDASTTPTGRLFPIFLTKSIGEIDQSKNTSKNVSNNTNNMTNFVNTILEQSPYGYCVIKQKSN